MTDHDYGNFLPEKYYLWSTRLSGWATNAGTYTSDRHSAVLLSHADAIERCKVHRGMGGEFGLVPVSETMLREILK